MLTGGCSSHVTVTAAKSPEESALSGCRIAALHMMHCMSNPAILSSIKQH
jgi:hypothetical protein